MTSVVQCILPELHTADVQVPLSSSLCYLQDMASWARDGVAGLQSVVLYSLPELDGAIDAIPLGGLVGDGIFLSLERTRKLAARIKAWVTLRRTPAQVLGS